MSLMCRRVGCSTPVVWAVTDKGASMIIDAKPNPDGNLAVWRGSKGQLLCRTITKARPLDPVTETPGMPHWATCSNPPGKRAGR